MNIKRIMKLKRFKEKSFKIYVKVLKFILTPLLYVEYKLDNKRRERRCDPKYYKRNKLEKLVYKTIQKELLSDGEIYIFDVDYIYEEDECSNCKKVEDLLRRSKYKYLKNYYNYIRPKTITYDEWFDIIKEFDNDEISVKEINKNELFTDKYEKYTKLYKETRRILKITIKRELHE